MIDARVGPDDLVFMVDIGPDVDELFISRDSTGVEISSEESLLQP